ncbi:MAG TPA: M1 family metallopeptidase, partial [Cytophagales bacterium]|nr:M1 family metallopeptidase [Cytophagales bacterium]
GSSFWWPSKDHPSDEPDSMRTHFTVPSHLDVVSNGNMESSEVVEGGLKKYNWKISYPINTYNVTFYIGKFHYFKTHLDSTHNAQELEHYVLPQNKTIAPAYYHIEKEVLNFYDKAFGAFPFPQDHYCIVESPYAGMEHQTAIAIGNEKNKNRRYVNVKDNYLIIHETAHEWWGNSVTAKDMAHAWIQEGFATYAEMMFIENKYGHKSYLQEILNLELEIFNLWPVVGNEHVNDNTFIGGDIYNKGALFLHTLRSTINDDTLFFKIIKTFAERNRYKMVETDDFKKLVYEMTGKDYTALFDTYLYHVEVPTLEYLYEYLPEEHKAVLTYRWSKVPPAFFMPFGLQERKEGAPVAYHRLEANTEWQKWEIKTEGTLAFINFQMLDCPTNYHTYHQTKMVLKK